jgi:hypothetical protein
MMTTTPRSAHSQSRVPAPGAGDGEPLTVGVGAALVGVAVTAGAVVAGVVAVTDGWTVVGAAVGLLGATLALLSGDVRGSPDGDNLPLMPLACAHPATMLAAAKSAMSSRTARRNRRANVSIIPPPREASPLADIPSSPAAAWIASAGLDWFSRPGLVQPAWIGSAGLDWFSRPGLVHGTAARS